MCWVEIEVICTLHTLCHILYLCGAHCFREKFLVLHCSVAHAQGFCSLPFNYWQFTGFTVYVQCLANEQAASISNMLVHYSKNMALTWFIMAFHFFLHCSLICPMNFLNCCFILLHIPVSRSVWAEERAAVQWERKHQEYIEQVYTQLKVELHKEDSKQHLKSYYHIPSASDLAVICSGDKLFEILELAPDPASVEVLNFSRVCKILKRSINFIMSVCPSA